MDLAAPYDALEKASLFDLWRLNMAVAKAMEDPRKIDAVRARLSVGQTVRYFDAGQNRELSGRIIEIKRMRAVVRHDHDQQVWNIPFYMMKLDGASDGFHIARQTRKIERDSVSVGDSVGYVSRERRQICGVVVKRNRKTATVRLSNGEQWKVSYSLLFPVIDAAPVGVRAVENEAALIARVQIREAGGEDVSAGSELPE